MKRKGARELKFLNFLYDHGFHESDYDFDGKVYWSKIKKKPSDKIIEIVNKLANEEVEFKDIDVETAIELSKMLKISINDIYDSVYFDQKHLSYVAVYTNIKSEIIDVKKAFQEVQEAPHEYDDDFENDDDYVEILKYNIEELEEIYQAIVQLVRVYKTASVCGIDESKILRLMWDINVLKNDINDFCLKEYGKAVLKND